MEPVVVHRDTGYQLCTFDADSYGGSSSSKTPHHPLVTPGLAHWTNRIGWTPTRNNKRTNERTNAGYIFLLHFLLTSYPQEPWRYFQIASCICLSTSGYTHEMIHILHQLFFITLSATDFICDFGCFITLFVISMYCTFSFMILLLF